MELNPVRAGLAKRARKWPWSSATAHLSGHDNRLVTVAPLLKRAGDWKSFLKAGLNAPMLETLRSHERTGRPLGDAPFVKALESQLGRTLARRKPGPVPKAARKAGS